MTYFNKNLKLLVQRPGPRTQFASSREGGAAGQWTTGAVGQHGASRAGRSDRWGTCSNRQLEGGAGCSKSLKSEASLFDYATKRASGCVTEGSCAYDAICYLINNASRQEWTVCRMQIWYRKEAVLLSLCITSNLKELHFKHC